MAHFGTYGRKQKGQRSVDSVSHGIVAVLCMHKPSHCGSLWCCDYYALWVVEASRSSFPAHNSTSCTRGLWSCVGAFYRFCFYSPLSCMSETSSCMPSVPRELQYTFEVVLVCISPAPASLMHVKNEQPSKQRSWSIQVRKFSQAFVRYGVSTHRRRLRRPEAHSLAGYANNSVERISEGYSSVLGAIPCRCIQMLVRPTYHFAEGCPHSR